MIDPTTGMVNTTGVYGAPPAGAFDGTSASSAFAGAPGMIGPSTGGYRYGYGYGRYGLPPAPPSMPGRVVIRAERDPGMLMDPRRWVPRLDGNLGFVVGQNADWLHAGTLDTLLRELAGLASQAPASGRGPNPLLLLVVCGLCGMLIPLAMLIGFFVISSRAATEASADPSSIDDGSENSTQWILLVAGAFVLLICFIPSVFLLFCSKAMKGAGDIVAQRSSFCVAWMARNPGYELTYHQFQTSPPYFELSRGVGAP
jgi:hypothetical protein